MVAVPERPFYTQTPEVVRNRMFGRLNTDLDTRPGSLAYTLMAPQADEVSTLWQVLDSIIEYAFLQTAYGGFLDAKVSEYGLARRSPAKATGSVQFAFSGASISIPEGTRVSNTVLAGSDNPVVVFVTDAEVDASSSPVSVPVTALDAGLAGNLDAKQINRLATVVGGVTSVSNADPMTGGTDAESDVSLRARALQAAGSYRGAGTSDDYERWALAVPGVGRVRVEPVWNGPRTVRLLILNTDDEPAGESLLEAVRGTVAEVAPFEAIITVAAPTAVEITVRATLTLDTGLTVPDVQRAVEASLRDAFGSARLGADVVLSQVGAALLVPGVRDYTALTVNGSGANVAIPSGRYAELKAVQLTAA